MKLLSDEALVEAYCKSVNLELDPDFINLLLEEISQRKIDMNRYVL
ncbi:MAG TPA: sporulation histidine kinase inhibitor Sda [Bacillota bacterium]|nr:sporulation histidine kinase inhibitor Sda [Bacillota bacterium]